MSSAQRTWRARFQSPNRVKPLSNLCQACSICSHFISFQSPNRVKPLSNAFPGYQCRAGCFVSIAQSRQTSFQPSANKLDGGNAILFQSPNRVKPLSNGGAPTG